MSKGEVKLDGKGSSKGDRLYRLLQILWGDGRGIELADGAIIEIRLRRPKVKGDDVLCIVKAEVEGTKFIAFNGAYDAAESLRVALERVNNKQIRWREDQPYLPGMEPDKK